MRVPVLYVDSPSIYDLLDCDTWPLYRDARYWDGPGPAIAHPPCGPWGRLRHRCTGAHRDCGPRAIEQITRHGGIVEHPAGSTLFAHCGVSPSIRLNQCDWGHPARKSTWLYVVGLPPRPPLPPPGLPTRTCEQLGRRARIATPPEFALWLLNWVRGGSP